MPKRFYVETLGCPKNAVDSDKVVASLLADGLAPAGAAEDADLVVVNTCAFIESARQESIDVALALADVKRPGAKLVLTGCMAERYGEELAAALPEADAVVGFAGEGGLASVILKKKPTGVRDLLELPRPAPSAPWAYVKIAEGCDHACAFCAIPSFRGTQRSRTPESIEAEARGLVEQGVSELVLVAEDLAWYGRDVNELGALAPLLRRLDALSASGLTRIRLLYLYPSEVHDPLVATMLELDTVVPYFDLSLQHASPGLLRRMKRWGSGDKFLAAIGKIRAEEPAAAFRSSFIVGFPGETEGDHEMLTEFLATAALDWAGFFPFSEEAGTTALALDGKVDTALMHERLRECSEIQDPITAAARAALVGETVDVLVDGRDDDGLVGRTYREAPEIDGIVRIMGAEGRPGATVRVRVTDAIGPDLEAVGWTAASTRRFGQGALATPANLVTLLRLVVAVPTLLLIREQGSNWTTVGLWFAITSTDSLDGWLARRDGTTRSGAFLDPVTDKLIVIGGLAVLADRGDFPWWPVLVIAAREIGISIYRSLAGRRGIVLPAQRLGKYKAFSQYVSVGFVLLPITADWETFQHIVLYLSVLLTVVSGLAIVRHGWVDFQAQEP